MQYFMAVLTIIALAVLSLIAGMVLNWLKACLYEKGQGKKTDEDIHSHSLCADTVWGLLSLMAGFEVICLACVKLNKSLDAVVILSGMMAAAVLLIWVIFLALSKGFRKMSVEYLHPHVCKRDFLLCILGAGIILLFYVFMPCKLSKTLDTPWRALTILQTKNLNQLNPYNATMLPFSESFSVKMQNMAVFYACICKLSGVKIATMVCRVFPVFWLLATGLVFLSIANLFFKDEEKTAKGFFVVFAAMLVVFSGTAYMNASYNLLYLPYEGVTILANLLFPFSFLFAMNISKIIRQKRGIYVILFRCIVLSFCALLLGGLELGLLLEWFVIVFGSVSCFIYSKINIEKRGDKA